MYPASWATLSDPRRRESNPRKHESCLSGLGAAGEAVPGEWRTDPHGSAGGPECVSVSDLPKVTERTPALETSRFAAGKRIGRRLPGRNAGVYVSIGITWVHR